MQQYARIFITGDKHGAYRDFLKAAEQKRISKGDLVIIAGDHGLLYDNGKHDEFAKDQLLECKASFLLVHGNHERRPTSPDIAWTYKEKTWNGGTVYIEHNRPRLMFAKDGERYRINDREYLIIGGAYSVDKEMRLSYGWNWFADEQLSDEEKKEIIEKVKEHGYTEDIVVSHTCPYTYQPLDCMLPGIDQSKVDKAMEIFLQHIADICTFNQWYCGHWHVDRKDGPVCFLSNEIVEVPSAINC